MRVRKGNIRRLSPGSARNKVQLLHSRAESEVIPLDAGSRMEGPPPLPALDGVSETFSPHDNDGGNSVRHCNQRHYHSHADKHMACDMVDNVPPSVPVSSCLSKLYTCDDNESVIRMVCKGRRLNLRPVSRTHRVTLDWFLERINLGTSVSVR